jgi:pilus assembly protein CpaE
VKVLLGYFIVVSEVILSGLVVGETLRILLVSTQESIREEVEQALAGLPGDFRLYWVTRPDLVMVRASDLAPHLIIVDDALGDVDPAELIGQLAASLPTSALLSLVQRDALETARRAILLGARAFVAKPIVVEELLGAVRQTVARRETPVGAPEAGLALGRVVVFCGPKGGTGRTTLAINTALSLGQIPGNSVVLVDADYAAPAIDVALNLAGQRDITDLLSKMTHLDADLVAGVLATHESGLHVLLAPPPATLDRPLSLPQVQQVLVWLRRMFPWVIVDLGLPLDETAFAFLNGADLICLSVNPEMIGLRNTRFMLDQLLAQGYPSDRIWPILNRAGLAGGLSLLELEGWLGTKIRYQIPNDQTLATDTVNRGVPMALSYRRSPVARACRGLARELMAALPAAAAAGMPVQAAPPIVRRRSPAAVRRLALAVALGIVLIVALIRLALPAVTAQRLASSKQALAPQVAATAASIVPPDLTATSPSVQAPSSGVAEPSGVPTEPPPAVDFQPTMTVRATAVAPTSTATATPTAVPTVTATETLLPTPTATPSPSQTPEPSPTPAPTATDTPAPTSTRPPVRPTATRAGTQPPRPSPTLVIPNAPSLLEPRANESRGGVVTFRWQPAGPLPAGAAYEVVGWNAGEDPASARGMAAPTQDTSLTVDLDALYNAGQFKGTDLNWSVIIVQTQPYSRLTQPAGSDPQLLIYVPPSGGGSAPPPPKPKA